MAHTHTHTHTLMDWIVTSTCCRRAGECWGPQSATPERTGTWCRRAHGWNTLVTPAIKKQKQQAHEDDESERRGMELKAINYSRLNHWWSYFNVNKQRVRHQHLSLSLSHSSSQLHCCWLVFEPIAIRTPWMNQHIQLKGSWLADGHYHFKAHRCKKALQVSPLAFKFLAQPIFSHCKSVYLQAFQMAKCPHLDYGELSFTMGCTHWWQGSIIIIITRGARPTNAGGKTTSWQTARVRKCVSPRRQSSVNLIFPYIANNAHFCSPK